MSLINLFPISLYTQNLNPTITSQDISNFLSFLSKEPFNHFERGGGFTKNQKLLDLPLFFNLKNQILEHSKIYLNNLGHIYEDLQINTSWGTLTLPNQPPNVHNHSNSYISGVYYLTKCSSIQFYNPSTQMWKFLPDISLDTNNPLTFSSCYFTPEINTLLLFPSFLEHDITPSKDDKRFSISFNIIPKGEFGVNTQKLYL